MSQTQHQNMEFLRRTMNHLTFEEVERYAWLAGATGLQSMAIRAQEEIAEQVERAEDDAKAEAFDEGKQEGLAEAERVVEGKIDDIRKRAAAILEDIEEHSSNIARHLKVLDEKSSDLSSQLVLLETL